MPRLIARLKNRDDTEHEQILIRIAIAFAILAILIGVAVTGGSFPHLLICFGLAGFLLMSALALLAHLIWKPDINPARRGAALLLDIGCLSVGMIVGGEFMVPLYPLFLWVIFGMGFRYGRVYLLISSVLGLLGFSTVITVSDYWRSQPLLAASLLLALIILPAYTSTLLKKLTAALEKAEEANRAKSRFLATMSHELRTPLNAIFGMANLLEADRLNANQRDMVATMRSAGHTLLELIDDLLDFARIESGRLKPHRERFDLHVTLAVVLSLLRHQALVKGLDLRASYDPDIPRIVFGSERWLKQILINLIGNALKFTDEGEVVLRVGTRQMLNNRIDLVFDVTDTGIGIAKDMQEQIFERFTQADSSNSRRYGGSGLGLSIARQLAELMGGTLTVESDIGKGAHFQLGLSFEVSADDERQLTGRIAIFGDSGRARHFGARLKEWGAEICFADHPSEVFGSLANCGQRRAVLVVSDGPSSSSALPFSEQLNAWFQSDVPNQILIHNDSMPVPRTKPYLSTLKTEVGDDLLFNIMHAALAGPSLKTEVQSPFNAATSRRILVAEDNHTNQKVVQKILAAGGHAVVIVENGEAMLDRLENDSFDLVFVDLNMPIMGGIEAVKLHRMSVGLDHPPFIALTADATEETRLTCADVGFASYLTKPLEMHDVLDVIKHLSKGDHPPSHHLAPKIIHHPRFTDGPLTLDTAYLRGLRTLDPDPAFFVEIINDFIDDASGLVDELEAAVQAVDDIAFRDRSHALQSSAAHIGAIGLRRLCQEWQHVGPDQLRTYGAGKIAEIRLEFRQLCVELRDERDSSDEGGMHSTR